MIRPIQNGPQDPSLFDPIERSVGAGLITKFFTKTHPLTGAIYGGSSGLFNYAFSTLCRRTNLGQSLTSATNPYFRLFTDTFSWSTSACATTVLANKAAALFKYPGLRLNPLSAIGVALGTEFFHELMDREL